MCFFFSKSPCSSMFAIHIPKFTIRIHYFQQQRRWTRDFWWMLEVGGTEDATELFGSTPRNPQLEHASWRHRCGTERGLKNHGIFTIPKDSPDWGNSKFIKILGIRLGGFHTFGRRTYVDCKKVFHREHHSGFKMIQKMRWVASKIWQWGSF